MMKVTGHLHSLNALSQGKEPLVSFGQEAGWASKPLKNMTKKKSLSIVTILTDSTPPPSSSVQVYGIVKHDIARVSVVSGISHLHFVYRHCVWYLCWWFSCWYSTFILQSGDWNLQKGSRCSKYKMVLYCSCWMEFLHQNTKQTCGYHVFQVTTPTAVGLQTCNCKLHFSNDFSSWSLYSTDKISLQLNVWYIIFMYFQVPWFEWRELSVEEQERYLAKKIWEEFKEEVSCTVRWIVLWYWQQEWVTELVYKYHVIFGVDWFLSYVVLTEVIIFSRQWFFHLYRSKEGR